MPTLPLNSAVTVARPALEDLTAALDTAYGADTRKICPQRLREVLAGHPMTAAECLTPAQRKGDPQSLCRHVLHADPSGRYTVVALVWRAGQQTCVHGHLTWCGYRVLEGNLTEERFEYVGHPPAIRPMQSVALPEGHITTTAAGRVCPHRLSHGGGPPAVSLHVYGVPGDQISSGVNDVVEDQAAATP